MSEIPKCELCIAGMKRREELIAGHDEYARLVDFISTSKKKNSGMFGMLAFVAAFIMVTTMLLPLPLGRVGFWIAFLEICAGIVWTGFHVPKMRAEFKLLIVAYDDLRVLYNAYPKHGDRDITIFENYGTSLFWHVHEYGAADTFCAQFRVTIPNIGDPSGGAVKCYRRYIHFGNRSSEIWTVSNMSALSFLRNSTAGGTIPEKIMMGDGESNVACRASSALRIMEFLHEHGPLVGHSFSGLLWYLPEISEKIEFAQRAIPTLAMDEVVRLMKANPRFGKSPPAMAQRQFLEQLLGVDWAAFDHDAVVAHVQKMWNKFSLIRAVNRPQ